MVSKIAVIALVAIVSVPILLGYAMNLNEVSITDYKETGESVNVTPLYQNSVGYSYAEADVYNLNTNFTQGYNSKRVMPLYESVTATKSTFTQEQNPSVAPGGLPGAAPLSNWDYFYFQSDFNGDDSVNGYAVVQIWDNEANAQFASASRIYSYYYDSKTATIQVNYYPNNSPALAGYTWTLPAGHDPSRYTCRFLDSYNTTGGSVPHYNWTAYLQRAWDPDLPNAVANMNVDLSAGFRIKQAVNVADDSNLNDSILNNNKTSLKLPEYPNSVLMTMDLSTITDASYQLIFDLKGYGSFEEYYTLSKTTDSSGVHWELYKGRPLFSMNRIMDLYYDSSRLSNSYQIYIDNTGIEFRFVGNWPTFIGPANYYQTFRYDRDFNYYIGGLKNINFWNNTPKMRVDASEYRAFEYPIIENQTYNPSSFKTNPATTISDSVLYGRSLTFGSNTYTITDGNITLGTHKVPVNGMVLDSIPNDNGNYDNRINGTKVSESANPATITFNGKWSASISTVAQESYTYTKTEWVAGSFGWNGMDHNFLLVGLITSFGVFIALGIYARRSRSGGMIPLMIVTGCASVLFFIML